MADPRPQAVYTSSQSELYAICTIGWSSFNENQPDFELFNTLYTPVYGTDALIEIEAAMNLPGFQERNEASEVSFIEMSGAHAVCILKWKALRSYIKSSFPSELQKPKIEAAGYDHFAKAANKNWDETKVMLTAGQHFIDNNTPELTLGGMPPTFAPEYALADTAFSDLYLIFTDAEQDQQEATDVKINANNAIYAALMRMFEDGQLIYDHDPSKRDRFLFPRVYELVKRPGGTDTIPSKMVILTGVVSDDVTGAIIPDATVNVTPEGSPDTFSSVTNELGVYELKIDGFAPTSSGIFTVNASALDYQPAAVPFNYTAGSSAELNIQLSQFIEPPVEP